MNLPVSGLAWSTLAQLFKQILNFLMSILLARLLSPNDFGLIGMVSVFTGFVYLIGELGLGSSVIQKEFTSQRQLSTLFWLNLLCGVLLSCLMYFLSSSIAKFYNEQNLLPILQLLSINILIQPLGTIHNAYLMRKMEFKKLALIEIVALLFSSILAVVLSLNGFGVFALVWQLILISSVTVMLLWFLSGWMPAFAFSFLDIRDTISYSTNLLGFNSINYWVRNGDNLLIGKLLGSMELGFYSRAYSIMLLPLSQITFVINKVMFPSLARLQSDKDKFKELYLVTVSIIALITFPMMIGLLVMAKEFVIVLFGYKWLPIVDLVRIFSVVGLMQSVLTTVGWIYQALGQTKIMFKWGIYSGIVVLVGFLIGIKLGSVETVAVTYALINYVFILYPGFSIPLKLINSSFFEVIMKLKNIALSSVVMGVAVWIVNNYMLASLSDIANLFIGILFGATIYFLLLFLLKEEALVKVLGIISEKTNLTYSPNLMRYLFNQRQLD